MALQSIGNWAALARSAASRLGTSSPAIVTAILAQWQCEQKGTWPPTRNNPGNVARGWASALSYPYTVEQPNPQPSNPIVTYPSPSIGAQAYADGLRLFSRYSGVRAAVAAGNGPGFLTAISRAGYGTGLACMLASYPQLLASNAAGAGPTGTLTSAPAPDPPIVAEVANYLHKKPTDPFTQADADALFALMQKVGGPLGGVFGIPGPSNIFHGLFDQYVGRTVREAAIGLQDTLGAAFGAGQSAAESGAAAAAAALAAIPAAIGNILAHLGELAFIAVVLLLGLWLLATGYEEG